MKTIRPLGSRVLIRRAAKAEKTKGGIILPDSAQSEKSKEGDVIAVGPGAVNDRGEQESMSVTVGDRVLVSNYAGTEVKGVEGHEKDELLIVEESEILGVLQ